jgi:uncharacterized membrane protein
MGTFQSILQQGNRIIAALCHTFAMLVVVIGVAKALLIYLKDVFTKHSAADAIRESRLEIGHSFSLALAFLIGASILNTTLAPTWNDIGQLAAIIGLRAGLNWLLLHEIKSETSEPQPD